MTALRYVSLGTLIFFLLGPIVLGQHSRAEWTIMVYMNAKNNLEVDGIENFLQISSIGSTADLNILVELGRPKSHYTNEFGPWSGVRRFYVRKGTLPNASEALLDLGSNKLNTDMGSATCLADFVSWSQLNYPAQKYMLVIWNHGQGWRLLLSRSRKDRARSADRSNTSFETGITAPVPPNGFRAVSYDEDTRNILFNRDIQDTLFRLRPTVSLDILGFDACLMSMVETAYAMRGVAGTMIASEELEPAAGWPYKDWLPRLLANPQMSVNELASAVVQSYGDRYGNTQKTTLSAIDLALIPQFVNKLSAFSRSVQQRIQVEASVFRQARLKCRNYGEPRLHNPIDLGLFLEKYAETTGDPSMKAEALALRAEINNLVIHNYASSRVKGDYGSNGVSIYFPSEKRYFDTDKPNNEGYKLGNKMFPVEFVEKEAWPILLHEYLKRY